MNSNFLEEFQISSFEESLPNDVQIKALESLENGKVLYFPHLDFPLSNEEISFLTPEKTDPQSKNISYNIKTDQLGGARCSLEEMQKIKEMIKRYALSSQKFISALLPHYNPLLMQAKTSLRTVEIFGRKSSYRKDDTRLHIDSFPSNPVKGRRLLRMFTNINPHNTPRVWRVGEPFEAVAKKMMIKTKRPVFGLPTLLKWLKITKEYRTLYDHYMLQIHDAMKKDLDYQKNAPQAEIAFPARSSWIVFTDQVPHAAMRGQHVLEQTFYLPANGLKNQKTSPLAILERYLDRQLI